MSVPIKIGLALGGGGARGLTHIGVLRVFEKYGIKPSVVVGASMGAVVGGAYAMGNSVDQIIEFYHKLNLQKFSQLRNWRIFSDSLIKDAKLNKGLKLIFGDATFKDTKIPFLANAVDLETGEEVILDKGPLWQAVRASSAIPFIFSPMFIDKSLLVDGGLINAVPVDLLRRFKDLDIIIGVDVGGMASRQYIAGMVWEKYYRKPKTFELYPSFFSRLKMNTSLMIHVLLRSLDILQDEVQMHRFQEAKPDLIIHPHADSISVLDFRFFDKAYEKGLIAAEEAMPALLKLIEEKQREKELNREKKSDSL